jgi:DNA primase
MNTTALHAETIKDRVSFRDAAERYGLEFNHANFAICPFHHEKTGSFKDKGRYGRCYGCNWYGDVLDFTGKLFDLTLEETIEKLDKDFSLGLPLNRRLTLREQRDAERHLREITTRREHEAAERIAHERLYDSLHDEMARLERNAVLYAPQSQDEEWHPLFCEAIRNLPDIQFQIDVLL